MIKLILHEGASYRLVELRQMMLQTDPSLAESTANDLARETQRLLVELPLTTVAFDPSFSTEDSRADDETDEEADSYGSLARYHPRHGGIQLRHLVGSGVVKSDLATIQLEILPKVSQRDDPDAGRAALLRMWSYAADLNLRDNEVTAQMQDAALPIHEWLIQRFLEQLDRLLARGVRAHYIEEEDNLATVRGRLSIRDNLRQNAFAPHRFYCRYEAFSPNRPENRLIRRTIAKIQARTQITATRKRAAALAEWLHEIPPSTDIGRDFSLWRTDRLMTHYQEIRPTCEWILRERAPTPTAGTQALFGRFVRMNDVFERYVTRWMQERLQGNHRVDGPREGHNRSKELCSSVRGHKGHSMLPDILIHSLDAPSQACMAVLDAKWKMGRPDNKVASREDFYQMYAYASHWLRQSPSGEQSSSGSLIGLVYPSSNPRDTSTPFQFTELGQQVQGAALRFLLPQRAGDSEAQEWYEGFLLDGLECAPTWLKPLAALSI